MPRGVLESGNDSADLRIASTESEQHSIERVPDPLEVAGVVDEIIVVRHNVAPGPVERLAKIRTRDGVPPVRGRALRFGAASATRRETSSWSPTQTAASAHATFASCPPAYAEDFDVVYGNRTVTEPACSAGPIDPLWKWGHLAVAKLIDGLFAAMSLTDVGCTLFCIRREALHDLDPLFTVDGSFFGPEMMVLSILRGHEIIQIPVNYTRRVGISSVTGNHWVAFGLGLRMIALILDYRLRSWLAPGRFRGDPWPEFSAPLSAMDLMMEPYDAEEEKER